MVKVKCSICKRKFTTQSETRGVYTTCCDCSKDTCNHGSD